MCVFHKRKLRERRLELRRVLAPAQGGTGEKKTHQYIFKTWNSASVGPCFDNKRRVGLNSHVIHIRNIFLKFNSIEGCFM